MHGRQKHEKQSLRWYRNCLSGALLARWLMADAPAAGLAAYQSGQSGAVLFGLLTLGVPNIHLLTLADVIASHFMPKDGA